MEKGAFVVLEIQKNNALQDAVGDRDRTVRLVSGKLVKFLGRTRSPTIAIGRSERALLAFPLLLPPPLAEPESIVARDPGQQVAVHQQGEPLVLPVPVHWQDQLRGV